MSKQLADVERKAKEVYGSTADLDLGEMKAGDYMIHVFLEKGRNFKLDDGGEEAGGAEEGQSDQKGPALSA